MFQVSSGRDSSTYDHKRQEEARGKTQSSGEAHQSMGCSASGCVRRVAKNETDAEGRKREEK